MTRNQRKGRRWKNKTSLFDSKVDIPATATFGGEETKEKKNVMKNAKNADTETNNIKVIKPESIAVGPTAKPKAKPIDIKALSKSLLDDKKETPKPIDVKPKEDEAESEEEEEESEEEAETSQNGTYLYSY